MRKGEHWSKTNFMWRGRVRPHTSWSSTFCSSSGHWSCKTCGSLSVTTQSDGTSQLEGPSSPMMVTDGNWRDSDVTMQRWAERSASVCKSFLPYNTSGNTEEVVHLGSRDRCKTTGGILLVLWLQHFFFFLEQCFVSLSRNCWKIQSTLHF